jgi:hypothetical protein
LALDVLNRCPSEREYSLPHRAKLLRAKGRVDPFILDIEKVIGVILELRIFSSMHIYED